MAFNLITESWLPVRTVTGRRVIRPDQMAEADVLFPDWPRADLNIACLEFLIGLVFLADPPVDDDDWQDRVADPQRLRTAFARCAPAFDLDGDGPRFLQDLEPLSGDASPPDMLFVDSAGANTIRNNGDLMVRRGRYPAPDLAMAAMALYALQAHAPSGGAGNRTSMRGGGPLVTLVAPDQPGLWPLVWANVPNGAPQDIAVLPWMRPTNTSRNGRETFPPETNHVSAEAFFGMPRRLRLVVEGGHLTGVVQEPWGTNYAGWVHPLTPYYRLKTGSELLPKHPAAGQFGYRNWLGVLMETAGDDLRRRAATIDRYAVRTGDAGDSHVMVAGWAMDNMKPRDFTLSVQPFVALPSPATLLLRGMIEAADLVVVALRKALKTGFVTGTQNDAVTEAFYQRTEPLFQARFAALRQGGDVAALWLADIGREARGLFDDTLLPALDRRDIDDIAEIVAARKTLLHALDAAPVRERLMLSVPERKGRKVREKAR